MSILKKLILILSAVFCTAGVHATVIIDTVSAGFQCNAAGTTCFDLRVVSDDNFDSISWHTAGDNAVVLGGNLATPENIEENEILLALLAAASINPWGNVQFGGISVGGWIGVFNNGDWVNLDGADSLASVNNMYPWYNTEPNGPLPTDAFVGFVRVTEPNSFNLAAGVGWADLKDFDSFFRTPSFFVETNVPEPDTLALLGLGLASLCFSRRKKV